MSNQIEPDQAFSGVAQTAAIGSSTSVSSGAAKIFREFKWGLLTLFILMTVVVCLVYDGGRKKKTDTAQAKPGAGGTDLALVDPQQTGTDAAPPGAEHPATADVWQRPATPETGAPGSGGTNNHGRTNNRLPDPGNSDGVGAVGDTAHTGRATNGRTGAEQTAGFKIYVVKSGDNLTRIANANLPGKGGNRAILDANKDILPDANRLREGMKLKIPNAIPSAQVADTGGRTGNTIRNDNTRPVNNGDTRSNPAVTGRDDYVIQSGDTLEKIARRVLNDGRRWKELQEWNRDRIGDASHLKVGTVLRTHPSGQMQAGANYGQEGIRSRSNTVRAEADPLPADANETQDPPNADEAPLPVHPVAANSTFKTSHIDQTTRNNAGGRTNQKEDDSMVPGVLIP